MGLNILVCDDDKDIVQAISLFLESENFNTIKAYNGKEALEKLESNKIHLLIIDVMMPQMDGITAVMKIRKDNNLPIIILSAKSEDNDKILGLNIGADDYITKPFNPMELIARVKANTRRYMDFGSIEVKETVIKNGGLELDDYSKTVSVDGEVKTLTMVEYNITKLFMENLGRVFSSDEIYERVWKEDSFASKNTIAVHIRRIREKIEINTKEPKYLKVVWGIGYKIEKL